MLRQAGRAQYNGSVSQTDDSCLIADVTSADVYKPGPAAQACSLAIISCASHVGR